MGKLVKALIGSILIVLLLIGGYVAYNTILFRSALSIPTGATVVTQIQQIGRLETVSYTLQKVIAYDQDAGSVTRIFGDHTKLFVVYGVVIAGFDLSKLDKNSIQIQGKEIKTASININMPAPQILSANVDPKRTEVYDTSSGFTGLFPENLDPNTTLKIVAAAQDSLRGDACKEGILQQASSSVRLQLAAFFTTMGFATVTINISTGTCM
jgi:hypothetical protein